MEAPWTRIQSVIFVCRFGVELFARQCMCSALCAQQTCRVRRALLHKIGASSRNACYSCRSHCVCDTRLRLALAVRVCVCGHAAYCKKAPCESVRFETHRQAVLHIDRAPMSSSGVQHHFSGRLLANITYCAIASASALLVLHAGALTQTHAVF